MTTIEHAMLGINGALSAGLHRRWGWQIVALAGVAATSPDWDGIFMLSQSNALVERHRVWGHNVLACVLTGLLLGGGDYYFDVITRSGRSFTRLLRLNVSDDSMITRERFSIGGLAIWAGVAIVAAFSHLPADMVVSGTSELPDWKVQLLWPFSHQGWVFPLVPWGDAGITIVFVIGMFAMARWKSHVRAIASATLLLMVVYIAIRPVFAA